MNREDACSRYDEASEIFQKKDIGKVEGDAPQRWLYFKTI
jgi:hypothetical protein